MPPPEAAAIVEAASEHLSPLQPRLPTAPGEHLQWGRLVGAAGPLAIAAAARERAGLVLALAEDVQAASRLEQALRFFLADTSIEVLAFPDWETLPYDVFSPLPELVSRRLLTLHRLPALRQSVLVAPVATLLQRLPPRQFVEGRTLLIRKGDTLVLDAMRRRLERAGYSCVSQVLGHGEYAVRGSLLDLFPMGSEVPFRIDLFDDEVETIRTFDPDTQRSRDKVAEIKLLPAREFPLTDDGIGEFRRRFRATFEGDPQRSLIYREVSEGRAPGGLEYYLPLFFEATGSLFDYLPPSPLAIVFSGYRETAERFLNEVSERHEQRRHDRERPILAPEQIYLSGDELAGRLNAHTLVEIETTSVAAPRRGFTAACNHGTRAVPGLAIQARAAQPAAALQAFIAQPGRRVLFLAESAGRRELLLENLRGFDIRPCLCEGWTDFLTGDARLGLTVGPLEQGLLLEQEDLAILTETQLYGERVRQDRRRRAAQRDSEAVVRNLTELDIGAPVVHEEHGVGRYLGLQTLEVGGIATEFLALEYAGGDKLYVPVSSLHLVSRYTGASPESAPLHRLGGEQWERIRRRAAQQVRDVAAELLDIYARRAAHQGYAFPAPEDEYAAFAAAFEFEETPDQQRAIESVLADMETPRPMDRVVCGDVGFGKTEVAMRAAFAAVNAGKQVAVLVPTTLLAQQHLDNFSDRFADWPVRVENLSRFRTAAEQKQILKGLAEGVVDVVVGTHKLLQPSAKFKNLGLVIIDEEHRFGVQQKERLKALRSEVDILTLTATPIPRTLNLALSGLRDLSIIATPPLERHPIKTFVSPWDEGLILEACQRELKRGGQVYFLHNEVETIANQAEHLRRLLPSARIEVAHGQMRERELERIMRDFYHQRFNLLVCTTIIESGIDIPTANTIIINRADKFGLAQLHQLRGRVGRSHHRAYAYLITPPAGVMTPDAVKRLEAIESLEELGAGFTLATHDLEIRGAGELLGEEQSGQIQQIGFSLYMDLLERAVNALKSGREAELERPVEPGAEIELHIPALIPDDYLPDVHTRLVLYKRIASTRSQEDLDELRVEMIDRFGLLPEPTKNLFASAELKLRARALGIRKIEAGPGGGRIHFEPEPKLDPTRIIELVQSRPQEHRFEGGDKLRFFRAMAEPERRIAEITDLLNLMSG
jgi:transcription-repair coupling factor (superfamily II helicase)